jgi:hypothetical protein
MAHSLSISGMKNITVSHGTAVDQTENKPGELSIYLWENGQLAVPRGK